MGRMLAKRLTGAALTVLIASWIAFLFMRMLPGDPARLVAGEYASDEAVAAQAAAMGLDQPIGVQYVRYMADFVTGDWGFSYTLGEPVLGQFARRLPASIELAGLGVLLAVLFAVAGALLAARFRGRWPDRSIRFSSYVGLGVAPFWLGLLLLMVFSQRLGWLPGPEGRLSTGASPPGGPTGLLLIDSLAHRDGGLFLDSLRHLVLPATTLGFVIYGFLVRLLRANLLDVSSETFVLVGRSKGRTRAGALLRDVLPNALIPTVTAVGLLIAQLLTLTLLVEAVFSWPGVGNLVASSILRRDYAVVQAFILVSAVLTVAATVVTDALYGIIDPRIRVSGEGGIGD